MDSYYERPMVRRIQEIFDWPQPPKKVDQLQFDGAVEDLRKLARTPWHEIDDWWAFLMDLTYTDIADFQQDLFDYGFPALLIQWWEGLLSREGGPQGESDFYHAIDRGSCLDELMTPERKAAVLDWMVDAYMDGVDAWSGHLDVHYDSKGPDNLHGPLWAFNALGQSAPIIGPIVDRLQQIDNPGQAQWWLVWVTGLTQPPNQCPAIPPWTPDAGGGGVYVLETGTAIYNHGFLHENLEAFAPLVTVECTEDLLARSLPLLTDSQREWAEGVLRLIDSDRPRYARRLERYLLLLAEPDLGGVRIHDDDPDGEIG